MNTFIKLKYSYDTRKKRIYIIYDIYKIYVMNLNYILYCIRNDIYRVREHFIYTRTRYSYILVMWDFG